MPYADLFVGLLIIVLLIVVAYRVLSSSGETPDRALYHDDSGKLIALGERERAEGQLSGCGSQTSAALELTAGAYRIDYQFDALTRLALIDANGDETLLIKSGTGTEGFEISEAGRYRLLVEPNDENASWRILYHQIGSSH